MSKYICAMIFVISIATGMPGSMALIVSLTIYGSLELL